MIIAAYTIKKNGLFNLIQSKLTLNKFSQWAIWNGFRITWWALQKKSHQIVANWQSFPKPIQIPLWCAKDVEKDFPSKKIPEMNKFLKFSEECGKVFRLQTIKILWMPWMWKTLSNHENPSVYYQSTKISAW